MKKVGLCAAIALIALALAASSAIGEDTSSASCEGNGFSFVYTVSAAGLRVKAECVGTGDPGTVFTVRDIALNGEMTGARAELTVDQRDRAAHTFVWQREAVSPVTVAELWLTVTKDDTILYDGLLQITPNGEDRVARSGLKTDEPYTVLFDNESGTLALFDMSLPKEVGDQGILSGGWLRNKTEHWLYVGLTELLVNGRQVDASWTLAAMPDCAAYADFTVSQQALEEAGITGGIETLTLTMAGTGNGDALEPEFTVRYLYDTQAPVSAPTMAPTATPTPRVIGTVTIRKSGAVNVRERDTTESAKIGSAKAGAVYPCLSISPNGWYQIELADGTIGYVTNTLTTFKPAE